MHLYSAFAMSLTNLLGYLYYVNLLSMTQYLTKALFNRLKVIANLNKPLNERLQRLCGIL